jgi:uncharacterized membrane protein
MYGEHLQNALVFLQANPLIAIAIAVILLALFYSKPKEMFKLAAFCLFIAVVFYFITLFTGTINTGAQQKDKMSYKSKKVLGE